MRWSYSHVSVLLNDHTKETIGPTVKITGMAIQQCALLYVTLGTITIHSYVHTYIHTYTYSDIHTYIHTYIHIHTYLHINRNANVRMYVHMYIQIYVRTCYSVSSWHGSARKTQHRTASCRYRRRL